MKKKLLVLTMALIAMLCLLAISVSAQEIDYSEKATLLDGTVLPIYDQDNNPLIWFVLSTDDNGVNTYASVPSNRNNKDNATSYVTFNINSVYGEKQLHDVYIHYWDEVNQKYVDYGEGTTVVLNLRGVDMYSIGSAHSSSTLEYLYYPDTIRSAGDFTDYPKLQLVDCSLATDYRDFAEQAFRNCKELREFRFGASVTGYALDCKNANLFDGCTKLSTITFANIGDITAIASKTFSNCPALTGTFEFTNVTTLGTGAFRNSATNEGTNLVLSFPNLVVLGGNSGDTHVFSNSGVKELYFGNAVKDMSFNTFTNCARLEIIEFKGFAEGFKFKGYTFDGCTALKAFSIPEGITELPSRMFRNCTSLGAVYLPSTLTAINSGDNDHATFKSCTNMYFVSKPFTSDNIPTEQDIYYFPSGLITVTGEAFDGSRVNDKVVFPAGVTSLTQGYTFEGSTSKAGKPTVIFLGNMESVTIKNWSVNQIFFANENDIDAASAGLTGSVKSVYCYAEGNTEHLTEKTLSTDATCTTPKMTASYCFCGKIVGEPDTVGSALGHKLNGAPYYTFEGLTVPGKTCIDCASCDYVDVAEHEKAIIVAMGYSVKNYGTDKTFTTGYYIDKEMLKNYEEVKGVKVSFGFGFNAAASFSYDGTLNSFAVLAPISNVGTGETDFSAFTYRMIYENDEYISDLIVIAAFAIEKNENGESVSFLNTVDDEFETVSYTTVQEKVNG